MRRIRESSPLVLGAVLLLIAGGVALFVSRGAPADSAVRVSGGTQIVSIRLDNLRVSPSTLEVQPGTRLTLNVTNTDDTPHDLRLGNGLRTPLLKHGESARLQVGTVHRTLPGWCTVPGHKTAGMTMTIKVIGQGSAPSSSSATHAPSIDFMAAPPPGWQPYDPALKPAPGATEHRLTLPIRDVDVAVAPGVKQTLWTFGGTVPGPTLRGHVGDLFTVTVVNDTAMGHGIDFHAGSVAPDRPMRTLAPGESLTYQFRAYYSGIWLYHCSTMPMALHIANGMFGAVIIDPPGLDHVDREFLFVQSELYLGTQNASADPDKLAAEHPDAVVFNGYANQYDHAPLHVRVGQRVRVWVLDAGPQRSTSFHVVGTQFDTVFKEGGYLLRAGNAWHGAAQTLDLAAAQGGFAEFVLREPGHYPFLDHAMVDGERGAHGVFAAS